MPAPSPTAPNTRSVRASSEAPTASHAANRRATASQLLGLGQPRPACSATAGTSSARAGRTSRNAPTATRAPTVCVSVGICPSKEIGRGNPQRDARVTLTWHPPASQGAQGGWPKAGKAATHLLPPPADWRPPPPGHRRARSGRRPHVRALHATWRPVRPVALWSVRRERGGRVPQLLDVEPIVAGPSGPPRR